MAHTSLIQIVVLRSWKTVLEMLIEAVVANAVPRGPDGTRHPSGQASKVWDDHCIPTSPHPTVLVKSIRGRKERMDATDWALDVNGWASLAWQKPAFHHQAEMRNKVLYFAPFSLTINHLTAAHKKTYKQLGELSCYSLHIQKEMGKGLEREMKEKLCLLLKSRNNYPNP